jgi:hypothetical protein
VATASLVGAPPFYFASENPHGAACSSNCTIAIPAISQRVLYYQVKYRDHSNKLVAASPMQAVAVPDKGTLNRVRLGPYSSAEEMNQVKAELMKRGVVTAVIKNP